MWFLKLFLRILVAILLVRPAYAGNPPLTAAVQQYVAGYVAGQAGKTLVAADGNGHASIPSSMRAPGAGDGANENYAANSVWIHGNLAWYLQDPTAGMAVWTRINPPLLCDLYVCTAAYGTMLASRNYTGNAARLERFSDYTTKDIPFSGLYIDGSLADQWCAANGTNANVKSVSGCGYVIRYDMSGNGHNETGSGNFGAWQAALTAGGSGYTGGSNTLLTLANTGGTCTTPTIVKMTANGTLTSAPTINQPGVCSVIPTQPQAVASGGGSGTGATFTITYFPMFPAWNSTNTVSNIRATSFNSYQFQVGNLAQVPVSMTIPTSVAWTPNATTLFQVGENVTSGQSYTDLMSTDGNYGFWFSNQNTFALSLLGGSTPGNVSNSDNCGVIKEASPEVTVISWNGTSVTCREGNQFGTYTSSSSPPAETGGYEGSPTGPVRIDDNILTALVPSSQVNATNETAAVASLSLEANIQPQLNDILQIDSASNLMGRASVQAMSFARWVDGMYRYGIKVFNLAQSGQALTGSGSELSQWGTNLGEQRVYAALGTGAHSFTVFWGGMNNDISNIEANSQSSAANELTLREALGYYVNLWKTLPTAGQTKIKVLLGETPVHCNMQSDVLALPILSAYIQDLETNWSGMQPTGGCTSISQCASGGFGGDGFVDMFRDPVTGGANALTGGISGTFPLLSSPNVPYCNSLYGVYNEHGTDLTQQRMGAYLKTGVDAILP